MPESLLGKVRSVDGVEKAAGAIGDDTITILDSNGDRIGPPSGGPPHIAVSVVPEPFNPLELTEGSAPTSDDQVVIDSVTADEENYQLGQQITITGASGAHEYTLSGIAEFGNGAPLGGASLAEFTLRAAQRLTGKEGKVDEIDVEAASGVTPAELAQRIQAVMPDNVDVRTGAETAAKDANDIKSGFSFLTTALLVFAGIAVFVGAFLIFNTFSITVAQRAREFAMLRTLGASRRQILGTVLAEAALVGLLASALGIAGGFGFVALIEALFKAMGFELPTSGLELHVSTVLIALAVGMLATLISALFPALRATRVAPLEALRETTGATTDDARQRSRRRTVIATILIVGAIALLALGLFGGGDTGSVLGKLGLGLVLLFIGLAMVGDRFVSPLASALGWPIERLRGVTGRLARENAQRQPARTATTAAALMIGVALVVFVGVFAASIRASINDTLDRQFAGDLAIVNTDGFSPIPAGVATDVAKVDGVALVSPVTMLPVRVEPGGDEPFISGIEPKTIGSVANLDWAEGSDATLTGLSDDQAILDEDWADKQGFDVGDPLEITGPSGDVVKVTVAGITHDSKFIVENLALTRSTLRERLGARDDATVFVDYAPGANQATTRAAIDKLLERPVSERRGPVAGAVQAGPGRPDQPARRADRCPARPLRAGVDVRRRQHALADDLRAHPRARDAARDRHLAAPGAADDSLRVGRHRAAWRGHRRRDRARPRNRRRPGALLRGSVAIDSRHPAADRPGGRDPDRGRRRHRPGAPRVANQRARGAPVRVEPPVPQAWPQGLIPRSRCMGCRCPCSSPGSWRRWSRAWRPIGSPARSPRRPARRSTIRRRSAGR